MLALGYDEYSVSDSRIVYSPRLMIIVVVQGGDIGSLVARFIARRYGPKNCKAHHIIVGPFQNM